MKLTISRFQKILTVTIVLITTLGLSNVQAQDKYGYATYSNQFDARHDDAYYLVISDPVKNWFSLSEEEQEEWKTNFRVLANKQIGKEFMKSHHNPVPADGDYEKFSSLAKAKESIQTKVDRFKKDYGGYEKPVKIIYVRLRTY